ncbi:hypothetical protein NM208_g6066 [Fusarium decemcellulare]|uniref:Uncharacterized protein n=1 Tax=Fusarium decemcellulare TaxID=57161 RepID=A0ACC1SEV5_9HYPO|nr:hypothetical protein NM208_g6066 [Fusarium decemcellulare]
MSTAIPFGTYRDQDLQLHAGVAPDEVSFISGETAWQEIYGFRTAKAKSPHFLKDPVWFQIGEQSLSSIGSALPEDHSRMRRSMSHAFSDRAIRQQQPIILNYVESLVAGLRDQLASDAGVVDIERWCSWTNFDLTGHLTFGKPFDCLSKRSDNSFNLVISSLDSAATHLVAGQYFTITKRFPSWVFPRRMLKLMESRFELLDGIQKLVHERLDREPVLPGFMTEIAKDPTTYLLLRYPDTMKKLQKELRDAFATDDDMTLDALVSLPYLNAVIKEGLRFHPPIPTGLPRVAPVGGATISGHFIPEGTAVYMSQYPANHSSRNFVNPDSFVPERWLNEPAFANDKRDVWKPFSHGPRKLRGLAYAQMRFTLDKVVHAFDLDFVDSEDDRLDQKSFMVWEKKPLMVQLGAAKQGQ